MAFRKSRPWGNVKPPVGAQVDWGDPISRGLVNCFLFNEGSGVIAKNITENKNGILTNAPTWVNSRAGTGISVTAATSYVGIPASIPLGAEGTFSAWVKQTVAYSVNTDYLIWSMVTSLSDRLFLSINTWTAAGSVPKFSAAFSTTGANQVVGTSEIIRNTWNMATVTWKAGFPIKLYQNGVYVGQSANNFAAITSAESRIGNYNGINTPFGGVIDGVRTWNRALLPSEILRLYTNPFAGILAPRRNAGRSATVAGGFFASSAYQNGRVIGAGVF